MGNWREIRRAKSTKLAKEIVATRRRKLASHEVAGVCPKKNPSQKGRRKRNISSVLSGRDVVGRMFQPLRGWLISIAPSEQRTLDKLFSQK
jgi:hypothetical protein